MSSFDVVAVRLGRLGDLVMTLPALECLVAGGLSVCLVTDEHHAPLLRRIAPEGVGVCAVPPAGDHGAVLDLHRVARSRSLVRGIRATVRVSVNKESMARRGLLTGLTGWSARLFVARPASTWPARHLSAARRVVEALGAVAAPVNPTPTVPRPRAPSGVLGLVPGAAHGLKRWPPGRWRLLADRWTAGGGRVEALLAPWESLPGVPSRRVALAQLPAALAGCNVVVAADTGPLHLAAAMGVPTVGLFGPTPRAAGFGPWSGERLVHGELPCRPCSLHGAGRCRRSRQTCMDHDVDDVLRAIDRLWTEEAACVSR